MHPSRDFRVGNDFDASQNAGKRNQTKPNITAGELKNGILEAYGEEFSGEFLKQASTGCSKTDSMASEPCGTVLAYCERDPYWPAASTDERARERATSMERDHNPFREALTSTDQRSVDRVLRSLRFDRTRACPKDDAITLGEPTRQCLCDFNEEALLSIYVVDDGLRFEQSPHHDDLRADLHAIVKIDHVVIHETEAAG